jgi:hypothetical protein
MPIISCILFISPSILFILSKNLKNKNAAGVCGVECATCC